MADGARSANVDTLLASVARGDRAAFATLYRLTSPKLYGLALRILRERGLAEDALQEAYADIWRRADSFDARRGRGETWMAAIARNRALDVLRRRGRVEASAEAPDLERLAAVAWPEEGAGTPELMALLDCLSRLEPERREAIVLAYYEGLTRDELAERFGRPVNTIKTWLRRGLMSLRACLDQ